MNYHDIKVGDDLHYQGAIKTWIDPNKVTNCKVSRLDAEHHLVLVVFDLPREAKEHWAQPWTLYIL